MAKVLGPEDGNSVQLGGLGVRFMIDGDEPARLLEIISPAGFEGYFAEFVDRPADAPPPEPAQIAEIAGRYGLELDFTSIPGLLEAHGLHFDPAVL